MAFRSRKRQKGTPVPRVLHEHPADSPGYTRLVLSEAVGLTQAGESVFAHLHDLVQEIHLHGQKEFDVPTGSVVKFPNGDDYHTKPAD